MALKKKKPPKLEAEQLYMLEILVERVDLLPEKNIGNEGCDLMVRVGFADLTPVDIVARNFVKSDSRNENGECRSREDPPAKSCLFVRTPSDLMRSVKSTPLSIEVYKIPFSRAADEVLLCAATASLPGYFCNYVVVTKDKTDDIPTPYILRNVYMLADEKGNNCGSASIHLRLSCFGSSVVERLGLREKLFVLRGYPLGRKFHDAESRDGTNDEDDDMFLLREILGAVNSKLHERDGFTLTRPVSPPRISLGQPGFEKLTSAEKLNDRKYRGLVYEAYPNEPTCSCLPKDRSTHPLVCRAGCLRSCCTSLRNPNALKTISGHISFANPNQSIVGLHSILSDIHPDDTRMRGGGEEDDIYSTLLCCNECMQADQWYRDDIILKQRLGGGGCDYANAASEVTTTVLYEKDKEPNGAAELCKPRSRFADGMMAGCICPGKEPSSWRTGTTKCTKKPCAGADCMMRAFKEAQDFVDSIGKVPGLAGLGLMDPSESPYFGRDIDKSYAALQEPPSEGRRVYPTTAPPHLQCTAPCNTNIYGRPGIGYIPAVPYVTPTTLVPLAIKPKKKEDKKEEKAEKQKETDVVAAVSLDVDVGPCGEPKCKSRRKVNGDNRAPQETADESQKSTLQLKPPGAVTTKSGNPSERGRQPKAKSGLAGDRDSGKAPPIRVSKRVMRYVYSIGEVYPGINYGHKNCVDPRLRVPANMGWLWNTRNIVGKLKPRIGWKPGAIGRYLYELLEEAKAGSGQEEASRARSVPSRGSVKRAKAYKTMSYASVKQAKEGEEETEPPPTLHVHRKDGTYYVTMYPIKQESTDVPRLEEPTKPLQFKIARNRDDVSVASSSTASDMEIEFSPPAAINRYRRKPDVVHVDTQVRQQEILDALKPADTSRGKKERKNKKETKEKKERKRRK